MSVWDDIADSREEAETQVRAALIRAIRARSMGRVVAVHRCAEPWPGSLVYPNLYRGEVSKFSLDALVEQCHCALSAQLSTRHAFAWRRTDSI